MRILDLIAEQQTIGTVGTVGSSATPPAPPQPMSQTQGAATPPGQEKPDPNSKQLDQLLKQNQINVNTTDDFLKAFTAIQQKQQLTPDQEKVLGDYAKATIAKPGLSTQVAGLMKPIMNKKPADVTTPPVAGAPVPGF